MWPRTSFLHWVLYDPLHWWPMILLSWRRGLCFQLLFTHCDSLPKNLLLSLTWPKTPHSSCSMLFFWDSRWKFLLRLAFQIPESLTTSFPLKTNSRTLALAGVGHIFSVFALLSDVYILFSHFISLPCAPVRACPEGTSHFCDLVEVDRKEQLKTYNSVSKRSCHSFLS